MSTVPWTGIAHNARTRNRIALSELEKTKRQLTASKKRIAELEAELARLRREPIS